MVKRHKVSMKDPLDTTSCDVGVFVEDGILIYDICDVSQNLYVAATHGMNYMGAATICDTSLERRMIHKTLNVPSLVWNALLDYDAIETSPPLDSARGEWIGLNAPVFVKMVQASFAGLVNCVRARHPYAACAPWSLFVGGTRDTFDAFLGFQMTDDMAVPESHDLFYRLEGKTPDDVATFFAPFRVSMSISTRVKVELVVRSDASLDEGLVLFPRGEVRVELRLGSTTAANEDRVFHKDLDGEKGTITAFMMERLGKILRRSAMMHHAIDQNEDEFDGLFEAIERIPLVARCHGCDALCSRYGKCTGCYQAAFCARCFGDASKLDPHVAMCERGTWNAIVEIPVPCNNPECHQTCSLDERSFQKCDRYGFRCAGCNAFWCKASKCERDHATHSCKLNFSPSGQKL